MFGKVFDETLINASILGAFFKLFVERFVFNKLG